MSNFVPNLQDIKKNENNFGEAFNWIFRRYV